MIKNAFKTVFITGLVFMIISCGGAGDNEGSSTTTNSFTLLKTMDISQNLSPEGEKVGRPDVIAIENTLYLA